MCANLSCTPMRDKIEPLSTAQHAERGMGATREFLRSRGDVGLGFSSPRPTIHAAADA